MKKVFLVDGTGIVFRAYYAFIGRPMTNSRGENTSAVFGTLRMLIQIIRDYRPDSMTIAFDVSRDTFRRERYAEYKAHREAAPEDLKAQIPSIMKVLEAMQIPVVAQKGIEADDIIGAYAEKYGKDHEVYIVSGDKDLMQLVGDNVKMIRPQKGVTESLLLDEAGVKETLGILPSQVADYLGIVGDKSDNIPGVKGIGDVGAIKLLADYGSIENIYAHIDEIPGANQKKLVESRDMAFLSKELATVRRTLDTPIAPDPKPLDSTVLASPEVESVLEHFEVKTVIADLKKLASGKPPAAEIPAGATLFGGEEESKTKKTAKPAKAEEPANLFAEENLTRMDGHYRVIENPAQLEKLVTRIREKGAVSVDSETTSTQPAAAELVGISLSIDEKEGTFVPFAHGSTLAKSDAFRVLGPVLEDENIRKIGQNIKYEVEMFAKEGVTLRGIDFDTMIAAYLINPARTHFNLDSLAEEFLRYRTVTFSEIVPKGTTIFDTPLQTLSDYACEDSDIALRLAGVLRPLVAERKVETVLRDIELPLVPVLAGMELNGVKVDADKLAALSKELESNLETLKREIYGLAGEEFNINSPQQLARILFEKMGFEATKKTPTGKPSTDEEVLGDLAAAHPLPYKIVEFRTYAKLKGTYVDALPALALPSTGRIHSSFNQTVAATGRLSSSDPNLQNIPIREKIGGDIGRRIREAFVPEPGNLIVSADYSQIELRVLAHFSENRAMRDAFASGADIHRHTAALVFGVPESEVTAEMRARAKGVNFGIIYGQQAYGLSRQVGISVGEAKQFIENYYKSFPEVRSFMENTLRKVYETGEVRTMFGRVRYFSELKGKKYDPAKSLNNADRMAINTPIQGTAADIMKLAMIAVHKGMKAKFPAAKMIMQIHDELVFEVPETEAKDFAAFVKAEMEGAVTLKTPLKADVGIGKSWAEAH